MLKKFILAAAASCFLFMFPLAFAQESSPLSPLPSPSPIEYALPYPGILPDHPLYFIKRFRDIILQLLITNPVKKVEFDILMADKHLNMAIFLFDKSKPSLAVNTVSEGFNYLSKAETNVFTLPIDNKTETANTKHRLEKSLLKHEEIFTTLVTKTNGDEKVKMELLHTKVKDLLADFYGKK